MNIKTLIFSYVIALTVVLFLFLFSEYEDSGREEKKIGIENLEDIRDDINLWSKRKWSKGAYDSLSAVIQTTQFVVSDVERDNLQFTLDGYYCNSMKSSFEDWKIGQRLNSQSLDISDLAASMNDAVISNRFRPIDFDPLIPLIAEYNDIKSVSFIANQVILEITKEYNHDVISKLQKRIIQLMNKPHVSLFPELMNELSTCETRLLDFEDFATNYKVKRRMNPQALNSELINSLRGSFPDADNYTFYNK